MCKTSKWAVEANITDVFGKRDKRKWNFYWGSGCGSAGRAVASNTRGLRFKSSHKQIYKEHLFTLKCIEKTKIKNREDGKVHFK